MHESLLAGEGLIVVKNKGNKNKYFNKIVAILLTLSIFINGGIGAKEAYALSLVDLEVFSNISVDNTSGTTPDNRWKPDEVTKFVDFTFESKGLADVKILPDKPTRGMLIYPDEFVTEEGILISPSGPASVTVSGLVNLNGVLTSGLLGGLLGLLEKILGLLSSIDLIKAVQSVIQDLASIENFNQTFDITVEGNNQYATVDIDTQLVDQLLGLVTNLLNSLKQLEKSLGLLGFLLGLLLGDLNKVVKELGGLLQNPEAARAQLLSATVLGSTSITMPMTVTRPANLVSNLDATFIGTITQASELTLVELDLLKTSNRNTLIYLGPEEILQLDLHLPDSLDFGSHQIQARTPYALPATEKGNITLTDTRRGNRNLSLGVTQTQVWQHENRNHFLDTAELNIDFTSLTGDAGGGIVTSAENQQVTLSAFTLNQMHPILSVTNASDSVFLDLSSIAFQLELPANSLQYSGSYQTHLTWTLSDGTTP